MNGNGNHTRLDQRRAPIHEALENFRRMRWCPLTCPATSAAAATPN